MPKDLNLAAMADLYGVNAMANYFNGRGGKFSDIREEFYNKLILDAMELESSNYIFKGYAKPMYVDPGYEYVKVKRYGGLTEHTTPLPEGVVPKSDKTMVESFCATYSSYGRYMEFTDRVDWNTVDPIITHYTTEFGKLAERTEQRLARNEMLNSTSILIPASCNGDVKNIKLTDHLTLNDYRLQAKNMKRQLVKPLASGNFDVIISPEIKFDLLTDPLIKEYLGLNNGLSTLGTNSIPSLFDLDFKETMLDEYQFGYELANPGELLVYNEAKSDVTPILRIYGRSENKIYYVNVPESAKVGNDTHIYRKVEEARLSDGSYIPEKVTWDVKQFLNDAASITLASGSITSTDLDGKNETVETELPGNKVVAVWKQLPIHKAIMVGADSLIETGVNGHTDAKMYYKPLGSAGVLDPIDQRQSIGFKIDAIGYALLRPEACVVCYTIPSTAEQVSSIMYENTYSANSNMFEATTASYRISANHVGKDSNGKDVVYKQKTVRDGYNAYGKVNEATGNVETNNKLRPESKLPEYNGFVEFGDNATELAYKKNADGTIKGATDEGKNPNKD